MENHKDYSKQSAAMLHLVTVPLVDWWLLKESRSLYNFDVIINEIKFSKGLVENQLTISNY